MAYRRRQPSDEGLAAAKRFLVDWPTVGKARFFERLPAEEHLTRLWKQHGQRLTREFASEHPGTRPIGWWMFSAPERRRVVSGSDYFARDSRPQRVSIDFPCLSRDVLQFGICRMYGQPEFADPPTWESQPVYLDRLDLLDLLSNDEREALGSDYPKTEEPVLI